MTPVRIEENKLKKGDRVVMHTCIESEEEPGKIWTCKSDQFTRGKGVFAQDSVFLEGYSGSFAPEFLQKVALPSEDERVLAALEESQQLSTNLNEESLANFREAAKRGKEVARLTRELAEVQQTIARQGEIIHGIDRDLTKLRLALVAIAGMDVIGSSAISMKSIAQEALREGAKES
ncbi:hypothetical protein NST50_15380 [Paenibacillus sp. FSL E2-0202]|uniref:hypothetical protein n=1 Tax=Paenibacillus sp. FSL E2-0202 TaxID=2954505 RepID=UPI0030EE4DBC